MASRTRVLPVLDFDVEADVSEAMRAFSKIAPRGVNRAASNALNVIGRTIRRESIQAIRSVRKIPARTIGREIYVRRAKAGALYVVVGMAGRPVSLKHYGAKVTKRSGITVNVTGKRKPLGVPSAFMSSAQAYAAFTDKENNRRTLGGHVFERVGRGRTNFRKLMGPSLVSAFYGRVVQRKQREVMARDWSIVFSEKLTAQLERAGFKR